MNQLNLINQKRVIEKSRTITIIISLKIGKTEYQEEVNPWSKGSDNSWIRCPLEIKSRGKEISQELIDQEIDRRNQELVQ
jgi:hypothetical protein